MVFRFRGDVSKCTNKELKILRNKNDMKTKEEYTTLNQLRNSKIQGLWNIRMD